MTTLIGLADHPVNGTGTSWMQNDFDYTALVSYYFLCLTFLYDDENYGSINKKRRSLDEDPDLLFLKD